jgi:hypothetical protein
MADEREVVLDLEKQRIAAIAAGDVEALKPLLSDDYVHVHMTGKLDDREGHFKAVSSNPRTPVMSETLVRVYGDIAVITGHFDNHMGREIRKAYCHRVLARLGGRWQYISVQLTPRTV